MPVPLIIDSDISPDSWAAILFAALNPNTDLLAVTASGTGEAHGPRGARNAQRLLHLAGRSDIPVGFGPARPLSGDKHFPRLMRFVIDRLMFQKVPAPPQFQPARDAITLITNMLRRSSHLVIFRGLTGVPITPLRNGISIAIHWLPRWCSNPVCPSILCRSTPPTGHLFQRNSSGNWLQLIIPRHSFTPEFSTC